MRTILLVVALTTLGCGNKKDGGAAEKTVEQALVCKPGEVNEAGSCKAVITAEKVAAVGAQQSRLDELGKLLDKADVVAAPIELMNSFRKLDEWKALAAQFDQLKVVDTLVGELDNAVKTLRTFRASLAEAETRLGNLKGELDALMTSSGATKKIEEVRAQIGQKLRETLEPLGAQVADTIQNALAPLLAKIEQAEGLLDIGCGGLKVSGGSPDSKKLCENAKTLFTAGKAYLTDMKDRPAKLFTDLVTQLDAALAGLVDDASKAAIAAAQTKVNDVLKLPAAP